MSNQLLAYEKQSNLLLEIYSKSVDFLECPKDTGCSEEYVESFNNAYKFLDKQLK